MDREEAQKWTAAALKHDDGNTNLAGHNHTLTSAQLVALKHFAELEAEAKHAAIMVWGEASIFLFFCSFIIRGLAGALVHL